MLYYILSQATSAYQTSYQTLRVEPFHSLSPQPCWLPRTHKCLHRPSWYLRLSAFPREPDKTAHDTVQPNTKEVSIQFKVNVSRWIGWLWHLEYKDPLKDRGVAPSWSLTHRNPVIFEIKTSHVFPPKGGWFGMSTWRLTLETGSLPDCHHHVLWVLPEIIA